MQNENPELKWETNSSLNIGLETRLFNRVNLSFEYYNKHSDDLLFKFIQPLSAGATDSSTGSFPPSGETLEMFPIKDGNSLPTGISSATGNGNGM
ncbi:TonB-dependent receptor [Bacteroides ovatus]|nr:TonB-dependent receptor [Bacteroides ovatus]